MPESHTSRNRWGVSQSTTSAGFGGPCADDLIHHHSTEDERAVHYENYWRRGVKVLIMKGTSGAAIDMYCFLYVKN